VTGYETRDVRLAPLVGVVVALHLVIVLVALGVVRLFDGFAADAAERDAAPNPLATEEPVPGPLLQADPTVDLALHREREARSTTEYAWIDRGTGVVRIPVERALELLVERGLPVRPDSEEER
jgi:hypothetical protein